MIIVIAIVVIVMLVKMFKFKLLKLKLKNDDSVKEDDGDEKRNAVLWVCNFTYHTKGVFDLMPRS